MVTVVVEGSQQKEEEERERRWTSFLYPSLLLLREIEICSICCSIKYCWAVFACRARRNTIGTAAMNNGTEGTWGLFVILSRAVFPEGELYFPSSCCSNSHFYFIIYNFLSTFFYLFYRIQERGATSVH